MLLLCRVRNLFPIELFDLLDLLSHTGLLLAHDDFIRQHDFRIIVPQFYPRGAVRPEWFSDDRVELQNLDIARTRDDVVPLLASLFGQTLDLGFGV